MKEPEVILKSTKLPNGKSKYYVKWKGLEEATWEMEDALTRNKELIEDFNFFCLTGTRYDEKKLEELRSLNPEIPTNQPQKPNRAVKMARAPRPYVIEKQDKQDMDKLDKERSNSEKHNQSSERVIEIPKPVEQPAIAKANPKPTEQTKQSGLMKGSQILSQKQQEIVKYDNQNKILLRKIVETYANVDDKVESIKLQLTEDTCVFQVKWQVRANGQKPYSQFYSYEQFKLLFPILYIQFLETCILECESRDQEIKFEAPGIRNQERVDLIKSKIMMNQQLEQKG